MRDYIRHPTSIPINIESYAGRAQNVDTVNLSMGGLCFKATHNIRIGTTITFCIPSIKPDYHGSGIVTWCKQQGSNHFDIGICFLASDDFYRARMIEQVCQIENYKQNQREKSGRELSSEDAAQEWIAQNAGEFDSDSYTERH